MLRVIRTIGRRQIPERIAGKPICATAPILSSTSPSRAADAEGGGTQLISEIAGKICKAIREQPRWEDHLLQNLSACYSHSLIFHPACIREVLRRQSLDSFLSLRYFLWATSSSSAAAADPAASTALFDALVATEAWGAAMVTIRSTKCRPESHSLNLFLHRLCTGGFLEEALEAVILLGSEIGFIPALPIWNAAMEGSLKTGRPDLAWKFYQRMTESRVAGDVSTVGLLARALCSENRLAEAHSLLRGAARAGAAAVPDVVAFTELVSGLAKGRRYNEMSAVLHLMIAAGRPPDIFTYQAIIHELCDNGLGAEGRRVFDELRRRGYLPDVPTFTAMIDGLCKMGCTEEALNLWEEMIGKGLKPNQYTFNVLVDHFWKKSDSETAIRLHQEMLDSGITENTVTCNTMIAGFCSQGMMTEALALFQEMPEKDVITYNTLIQGFAAGGRLAEAMGIYRELLAAGEEPGGATYDPIIAGICRGWGDPAAAAELMEEMARRKVEPLSRCYDWIIRGFCDAGKAEEAMLWLGRALFAGNKPEEETFSRLVTCLCAGGRVDDALLVVSKTVMVGRGLGEPACVLLIESLCSSNPSQVDDCMRKILADT